MKTKSYQNFDINVNAKGVATVSLDVPRRPMNVITESVMTELDEIVTELELADNIKLVVFRSAKESGFLAGADVEVIREIESPHEAESMLTRGQRLFGRIEALAVPTVVLIHGPCLGGGLEWALACDYRIARDNTSTKIGLPEIKLGLIPGWGGTARLQRLVGLCKSLELILTGKHLSASDALSIGLVDRALRPSMWRDEIDRLLDVIGETGSIPTSNRSSRLSVSAQAFAPMRRLILNLAGKQIARRADHYPALRSAMRAIDAGCISVERGLRAERDEFAELIQTKTCRSLIELFFARERARSLSTWCPDSARVIHQNPIRKLGVVGAGAMGAGIVQLAATRGFSVAVKEIDDAAVASAREKLDSMLGQYARRKNMTPAELVLLRDRIEIASGDEILADADCVVEAVVEKMEVKQHVLSAVERVTAGSAILATNTSALSVATMGEALQMPRRLAGLHFFNPVHRMELVEIVRAERTDDATIERLVAFVKALGKTPVVTTDTPGFIVNRILFPYLGKATELLLSGVPARTIDREAKMFGMPMGPIELLDQVGLDVALHVAGTLTDVVESNERVAGALESMVRQNQCGVKTGLGFYDYRGKKRAPRDTESLPINMDATQASVNFGQDLLEDGMSELGRVLIYPMLAEAARCLDEKVVEHAWAIDLAMVLGTGFAPHRGGPLSVIDEIGRETFEFNLEKLGYRGVGFVTK
ncbi:MAG: 3-hydroxyacyl-CoA dehydrogenase NAD-binding domain-containing protein [Planctomycetota bacterium]